MPLPELRQLDVTTPLLQAYQMRMMQGREERDLQRFGMEKERLELEREKMESSKKTSALDYEKSLVAIGEHYMKAVRDKAEYDEAIGVMVNKYGANPNLFPQVKDDAEAVDTAKRLSMSAVEYQKVLKGEKSTMFKMNPDGTQSKVPVQGKEEVARYKGLGFDFVETTGKKEKPLKERVAEKKALTKAEQEVIAQYKEPKEKSFEKEAYEEWKLKPENKNKTRVDFTKELAKAKKVEKAELTPSEVESRMEHLKRSYGAPRDQMGRIQILDSENKKAKLIGWLKGRQIEEKKGGLSEYELDRTEQAIMTELDVGLGLQHAINMAKMQGATIDQIIKQIQAFVEPE